MTVEQQIPIEQLHGLLIELITMAYVRFVHTKEGVVDIAPGKETAPPFHPPSLYYVCIKKPQSTAYAKTPLLSAKSKH